MVDFLKLFAVRFARNAFKAFMVFVAVCIVSLIFTGMSWLFINSTAWFWPVLIIGIITLYSIFEASTA